MKICWHFKKKAGMQSTLLYRARVVASQIPHHHKLQLELDLDFELFLLEELLPDALAGGQEGYCVCTVQVATCFLRQLQLPPT